MIDVVVLVVLIAPLVDLNKSHGPTKSNGDETSYSAKNQRPFESSSLTPFEVGPVGASCKER